MKQGQDNSSYQGYVSKSSAGRTELMTNIVEEKNVFKKLRNKFKTQRFAKLQSSVRQNSTESKQESTPKDDSDFIIIQQDKPPLDKKRIVIACIVLVIVIAATLVLIISQNTNNPSAESGPAISMDEDFEQLGKDLEKKYTDTMKNYDDTKIENIENVQQMAKYYFASNNEEGAKEILNRFIGNATNDTALSYYYGTFYEYYVEKGDKNNQIKYLELLVALPEETSRFDRESWWAIQQDYKEALRKLTTE